MRVLTDLKSVQIKISSALTVNYCQNIYSMAFEKIPADIKVSSVFHERKKYVNNRSNFLKKHMNP